MIGVVERGGNARGAHISLWAETDGYAVFPHGMTPFAELARGVVSLDMVERREFEY